MRGRVKIILTLVALTAGLVLCLPCPAAQTSMAPLHAVRGVLDLRARDLDALGHLRLDGQWEFYWHRFLLPGMNSAPREDVAYIQVPGSWNGQTIDGKSLPAHGWATYRLIIKIKPTTQPLAIYIGDVISAYSLYVNGRMVRSMGWPSEKAEQETPAKHPGLVSFLPENDTVEVLLHVSNHCHRVGGLLKSLVFGREESLALELNTRHNGELFIMGIVFMMGLYHLGLYLVRPSDKSPLYFGSFCLVVLLRVLVTGEVFLGHLAPALSWEWLLTLEYLSFYLSTPVFALYMHNLFPRLFARWVVKAVVGLSLLFALFALMAPVAWSSLTVPYYQVVTMVTGLYLVYVLIVAVARKRPQSYLFLAGFILLFLAAANDILFSAEIINTTFLIHYGLVAFILLQGYALAVRYARAFREVETQAVELGKANQAYQNELVQRKKLEEDLLASRERIKDIRGAIILGLAKLAEYRDHDTGAHLERIREFAKVLAQGLAGLPKYARYITPEYVDDLYQSSILHDVGKVGVPDAVLLKPGKLTDEEFDLIKTHPVIGGDAIKAVEARVDGQSFLTLGRRIAYHHHEKFNGTGYPDGLTGEKIPLSARIVALADVYDALTTRRPYKDAFSHEKARQIIVDGRGSHFDPDVVDVFLACETEFLRIKEQMSED